MMTDFLWVLLIIFLSLMITLELLGFYIAWQLINPKRYTLASSRDMENQLSFGLMDLYDTWEIHKTDLLTKNGYTVKIYDIIPEYKTNKFCVMAHGYTYTHHGMIKYAKMMIELGYHVILFDQRYHGDSKGKYSTLGGKEKFDLYDVISYVYTTYGSNIYLGTFGESMGSSTVILEQEFDERVKFVLSDCGFSSLETLIRYLIKRRLHLPTSLLIAITDFYFRLFTHISIKEVTPKRALEKTNVPFFFAHGLDDLYILPFHAQVLFDTTPSKKKLYLGGNSARHAETARKNEKEYFEVIHKFIEEVEHDYNLRGVL